MIREFHHIDLRGRNSFGVAQHARRLVEFETADDLRAIFAAGVPDRWTVLSGGNNILFTQDYDGVLLTPVARGIELLADEGDEVRLRVEAGVEWDDLVAWAVERGLWGIENLSLIPGKAGAAPVQNIGAYGCEASDAIRRVEKICVGTGNRLTLDAAHCAFGYRESGFKHELRGKVVITAIEIALHRTPRPRLGYGDVEREGEARGGATLRNIREAICAIRRAKLPDPKVLGNAGSFFKTPVVEQAVAARLRAEFPDMPLYPAAGQADRAKLAAGWLIERAGMQGYRDPFNRGYYCWDSHEKRLRPVLAQLAQLRHTCEAFHSGALRVLRADGGVLLYQRIGLVETAEIIVNRTEHIIVEPLASGKHTEVNPMGFTIVVEENGHNPNHSYYDIK